MYFEIGPFLADDWFGIPFSTAPAHIFALVTIILPMLMSRLGVSVVQCDLDIK